MTELANVITSRDNPLIKELRRLSQDPAHYRKSGRIWVEGEHLCEAAHKALCKPQWLVMSDLYPQRQRVAHLQTQAKVVLIADALMREISALESSAGIGMVLTLPTHDKLTPRVPSVVLDRIQDPGNAGSILRSAAAFGCQQVLAIKGSVALWSPKVLRAGMGAHFSLRIVEGATLAQLRDLDLSLTATSSHRGDFLHVLQRAALDLPTSSAADATRLGLAHWSYVFGHEGAGVSAEMQALVQRVVRIAQPGGQESLNVAAAAAICLHASAAARLEAEP